MQTLLSSRGLAALAWVSTFAALWAGALGIIQTQLAVGALATFSGIIAILAMASASQRERR